APVALSASRCATFHVNVPGVALTPDAIVVEKLLPASFDRRMFTLLTPCEVQVIVRSVYSFQVTVEEFGLSTWICATSFADIVNGASETSAMPFWYTLIT